ncbi:MAG: 1-deoxy-D-xylulose-5-phosphate reductoisomerase [Desulfobacterales bacterium]|nr:1-deoxy-D-xylulose-5-phosphate reductoisomerase [Desulfobacterales bacterium]
MKNISILGSTGSIGCNTLNIVQMFPERFSVKALTAKDNVVLLAKQIEKFLPEAAVVFNEKMAIELKGMLLSGNKVRIMHGLEGYKAAATWDSADTVVSAMVGSAGLLPTLAAIEAGKQVALANKETLVMAGPVVLKRAAEKKVKIIPVDSEHSAIFQCISGNRIQDMKKIFLTASGGPFLKTPAGDFASIIPEDALNHPTWQMGNKISVDSATLLNKGLEVLEAQSLFGVVREQIEVLIHPQSIVHSMVSFKDGSVMAQLSVPDMKLAIAYALSHPERLEMALPTPDFKNIGALTFDAPDLEKFPCLSLAYDACAEGGTQPAVLNAANEVSVDAFLTRQISFIHIPMVIQKTMAAHRTQSTPSLSDIMDADRWAREKAQKIVAQLRK